MSPAAERFDVVVIGSGFGGSVTAQRLAEAGRRVLVLERGRPWPPGGFPRTPLYVRRNFWDPAAGLHGLFEISSFSGLAAVTASGLGGGSLIYANVMLRKPPETFIEDAGQSPPERWPLSAEDLAPHYDRVQAMQAPNRYPYPDTPKHAAIRDAAATLGREFEAPLLAVDFAADGRPPRPGEPIADAEPNLHGVARRTCTLCGACDVGCNEGAKRTLDLTYLSAARRLGAEIRTCCEARSVLPAAGGGWTVAYDQHAAAREGADPALLDPDPSPRRSVEADRVVVAGGTFGTTKLLLRSRPGLPGLSPRLGFGFSSNGDLLSWIRGTRVSDGGPRYLEPALGPVITGSLRVPDIDASGARGYWIQDGGFPALGDWLWQQLAVPRELWRMRGTFARRIADRVRGRRDTNFGAEISQVFGDASASGAMMPVLGLGRDRASGRLRMHGETLACDWRMRDSKTYFRALEAELDAVAGALGGHVVPGGLARRMRRVVTVHPLGGCPMAVDARLGVVDPWGRVHGCPGLYVADGAAMPGPVGPNPSFTIAAFADRVADGILDEASLR